MMPTAAPDHHQLSPASPVPPHQLPMPPFDGTSGSSGGGDKKTNVLFYNGTSGGGSSLNHPNNDSTFNLLRRLANSQFQSYNTALTVTIVVGCFLLLLNILIFVGIYYQREKRVKEARQKDELVELDCQYGGTTVTTSTTGDSTGGLISARSPSQGSEKNGLKGVVEGATLSRKGSFQSVRNFGNFNEYRCYDEKNFQQQQQQQPLGHHHHYGSRHHLHHHHSHGSLNRKYLVDVCHNATNGSVVDLPPLVDVYTGDVAATTMNRELSASSSHIAHNGSATTGTTGNNVPHHHGLLVPSATHQSQQQLHHQHHHVCPSSRRQSMVTEGTQSDPISLQELEYETNRKKCPGKTKRKSGSGCDASDCRNNSETATGTQTESCAGDEEEDDPAGGGQEDDEDEEEEEEEEDDEELVDDESPDIPDPPPPPRSILTGGILRTSSDQVSCSPSSNNNKNKKTVGSGTSGGHAGSSSTPSSGKKRVQIQEISV